MSVKEYILYKLRFSSSLHIGNNRDDYGTSLQTVASDTFHAALIATLAKQGDPIPSDGDIGCVISSLFPFYQKDIETEPTLFFPMPLSAKMLSLNKKSPSSSKRIKAIQWIDKDYLVSNAKGDNIFLANSMERHIQGSFLSSREIDQDFIQSEVIRRVTVSRCFEDSRPFYMDRISFLGQSGLFFIAEGDTSLLDKAMPLLAAEGIGTDRNVGNGHFSFEKSTFILDIPDNANYGLILSTFIPENADQLSGCLKFCAYELIRRGGWITAPCLSNIRKNAIYGFAAGSVFSGLSSFSGKVVDLAPNGLVSHPVWRCGKALVVPIIIEDEL